jgi:uncharacterized SAM-dependent methyltransferase
VVSRGGLHRGGLLIGVDLRQDPGKLHHAYNDWEGVTAASTLNVLVWINRELGADFDLYAFHHHAFYDPRIGWVELYMVSLRDQVVHVGEKECPFAIGESVWTESSFKYGLEGFASMAESAGFRVGQLWMDSRQLLSVQYLKVLEFTRRSE